MVARIVHASSCLQRWQLMLGAFLVPLCLAATSIADPSPSASAVGEPVYAYDLMPGVRTVILDKGGLEFHYESNGITHLLLEVGPADQNAHQGSDAKLFFGVFAEGESGGQRGFAREADDDSDGLLDEDRADGLDNDGDGLVDEDFMAVSDAMVVVSRTVAGRRLHLETYHWNYSHLRSGMALYFSHTDAAGLDRDGNITLKLPRGIWYQADLSLRNPNATGDAIVRQDVIYVAPVSHPDDPDRTLWLGAYPLPRSSRGQPSGAGRRVQLADETLDVPLRLGEAELAISVAPSLLQLRCNLMQFRGVRRGVPDMTGRARVEWIVPPTSLGYRGTTQPLARWMPFDPDGLRLVFAVQPGDNALFDPDRFSLDGRPLGSPTTVIWRSQDEQTLAEFVYPWIDWSVTELERLVEEDQDPYLMCPDLLEYTGAGDLIFEFAKRPELSTGSVPATLMGQTLCGRTFEAELGAWIVAGGQAETHGTEATAMESETGELMTKLNASNRIPTLNPDLLENYPNPFQNNTSIKFKVPETVAEGFVWEEGVMPSLALESRIPYSSGQPAVTLKVYSLGGKEIATLFSGSLGTGEYHASWDGTDAWGRTVASGTYFCKLQVESWSVTKRLIFVR